MTAFLILILAAFSRLIPHALHGIGLNFTAVGGGLLFFGARRPRWQALIGMAAMAATDVYLTRVVFDYAFHLRAYLLTWAWYAGVCFLGSGLLRRLTALRALAAVFCSATSFFLLSNFAVWLESAMYAHSVAGLFTCYEAAVPFYANDVVSTGLTVAVLFALPVAAARLLAIWHDAAEPQQPAT